MNNFPPIVDYKTFNFFTSTKHFSYNNFNKHGDFICDPTKTNPNIIAHIFEDNWDNYYLKFKSWVDKYKPNANDEVNKMIDCYNKNLGFDLYICEDCNECFTCAHTCKSRFCSSCGIKYQNNLCESILQTAHKVKHRQIVFTMAKELWPLFFDDFNAINVLYEAVADTLYSVVNGKVKKTKNNKFKNRKHYSKVPGFWSFLHTFGRDLKWHPHIHVLIAESIFNGNVFKNYNYFDYDALSRRFQVNLLYKLDNYFGKTFFSKIKNQLFLKYKKGFYVYAEPKIFKSLEDGVKYVTRYSSRPCIGLKRILNYDGDNVTFCFNVHKDNIYHEVTLPVFEFITLLIGHLIPKNFRTIRAYGFYNKKHRFAKKVINMIDKALHKVRKQALSYFNYIKSSFNKNPLECPSCGKIMAYQFKVLKGFG